MAQPSLPNKTAEFFYKLSLVVFLCGMPNFWIADLNTSKKFTKTYRSFSQALAVLIYIFLCFEVGAFLTEQNLNEKQEKDLLVFGISHPMLWGYSVVLSQHAAKIKNILFDILELKRVFNDEDVEKQMVKKSKLYSLAFISSCMLSMTMYTVDGVLQVLVKGTTFTTVVTAWPDVDNNSVLANVVRVVWNISWWTVIVRAMAVYAFVFSLTTNLSHQFIDLQKYFYSLDRIFDRESAQQEMEMKYEAAFKAGIDLFNNTLQCVNQSKDICGSVFSGQIIFNIILLVILMAQLLVGTQIISSLLISTVAQSLFKKLKGLANNHHLAGGLVIAVKTSERTLMSAGAIALSALGVLIGTGLFMCNAGDVTVEASHLATAMYASGWHNCQGRSSYNVRQLLVFSMMMAQEPVVVTGLGIVQLSYQSYVSLVKSTYSLFSVMY